MLDTGFAIVIFRTRIRWRYSGMGGLVTPISGAVQAAVLLELWVGLRAV